MTKEEYLNELNESKRMAQEKLNYYIEELQEIFRNFRGNQYRLYKCKTKMQKDKVLIAMRTELEYVERKINEIGIEIGPMTKNRIEYMFDYDIALMRTYATGCVYDEDNKNIFD